MLPRKTFVLNMVGNLKKELLDICLAAESVTVSALAGFFIRVPVNDSAWPMIEQRCGMNTDE